MRLSVLDQSPIIEGSDGPQALRNTIDLAVHADALGFNRYWLAEHHGGGMLAGPSPEVLIGPVASATERIRVGSGGVMLPHYSPFKVAESFSVLAGLFPGRIDLALGRAAGTDPLTTFALQRDRREASPTGFPQQLTELLGYLFDRLPKDHPFARLTLPGVPERPEPWLLGSSHQSAIWAGELGLPYAFADFINPGGAEIAQLYRERFVDNEDHPGPEQIVGVAAICAETDEEAERLSSSARMAFTLLREGRLIKIPPVDTAVRFVERRGPGRSKRRWIVGSPETVKAGIEEVAELYHATEVMLLTIVHDHEARKRSYELVAEAFGLRPTVPDVERTRAAASPSPSR